MQLHLDAGDEVSYYHCSGNLHACEVNKDHSIETCLDCIGRKLSGLHRLVNKGGNLKNDNYLSLEESQKEVVKKWSRNFSSIAELKKFEYEGIDMGMGVASSLISLLRDSEPDMTANSELVNALFKASLSVFYSFTNRLKSDRPDLVYFFNGRFSNLRPLLRLCESMGINFYVHERGSSIHKYGLFFNHLPHSPGAYHFNMLNTWAGERDEGGKIEIANRYFVDRRNGIEQAFKSFITNQHPDLLPESWDESKRNIVIFNSSDDEFAAVGREFDNPKFGMQLNVLKYIKQRFSGDDCINIYLRMHPNQEGLKNQVISETLQLYGGNFHVLPPDSPVSTYKLMESCNAVVTFGSTTGIESTFWKKPSILVGNALYKRLDVTYNPETPDDLVEMMRTVNDPKPVLGAYIYGFHRSTFGISYRHYKPLQLREGLFMGHKIDSDAIYGRFFKYNLRRLKYRFFKLTEPI
jgi:hypothetical protein